MLVRGMGWLGAAGLRLAGVAWLLLAAAAASGQTGGPTPLRSGQVVLDALAGGARRSYSMTLRAGDHATLYLEQRGVEAELRVAAPAGEEIIRLNADLALTRVLHTGPTYPGPTCLSFS